MQKKAENTFSISKFIQKNIKKGKKKAHLFRFFSLLYPLCIFLHFKPKNSYKKRQKCKKKTKKFLQISKINMQKKHKIIFQKKMQKKHVGCISYSFIRIDFIAKIYGINYILLSYMFSYRLKVILRKNFRRYNVVFWNFFRKEAFWKSTLYGINYSMII